VLLLDKGAKMDVKDTQGKTPLALAVENRNDDAVKLLRERGAKE
jgi:ankyrin repeat protein